MTLTMIAPIERLEWYQKLVQHFNEGELRTLCFVLRVDYDELPGQGKADKARELIYYLERHERFSELVEIYSRLR